MRSSTSLYGGISWGSPYGSTSTTKSYKESLTRIFFRVFRVFRVVRGFFGVSVKVIQYSVKL